MPRRLKSFSLSRVGEVSMSFSLLVVGGTTDVFVEAAVGGTVVTLGQGLLVESVLQD
jgi:glutamate synthase domain-containing protein 3